MQEQIMIAKTEQLRDKLRDYLDAVQMSDTQIVIQRHTKPVAVLIGYEHWQRLQTQIAQCNENDKRSLAE